MGHLYQDLRIQPCLSEMSISAKIICKWKMFCLLKTGFHNVPSQNKPGEELPFSSALATTTRSESTGPFFGRFKLVR